MADEQTPRRPASSSLAAQAHRIASRIAVALAVLGALFLVGAAGVVTASVILRVAVAGQVRGDFEIMAVASGIAIVLFLPYVQARRSHVAIEVFTAWLPAWARRGLETLWSAVLVVAAALLAWRLLAGLDEAWHRGDVTMMLRLPLAVVFLAAAVGVIGTALLALLDVFHALSGDGREAEGGG
jgi:TRAP-type C4-dicarboxylate transport system permease small subunit